MSKPGRIRGWLAGDAQADRVVPPTGFTAQLTLFVSGAMAFLAVFAVALSLASGRLADRWAAELARSATLRISAPVEERSAQTEAALEILRQTEGVAHARAFTADEQAQLLAPWFGEGVSLEGLPVPQLIEVIEGVPGYDRAGLRLRLSAELPGAVLDDHTQWRQPLVEAATSLRRLGHVAILLISGATAAMITLAAQASLAANAQVIRVLRQVGARDAYIAQAFVRRFTLRAFVGAGVGTALGMIGVWLLPEASVEGGFLTGLGFQGVGWIFPLSIPILGALVALGATATAARRTLQGLA